MQGCHRGIFIITNQNIARILVNIFIKEVVKSSSFITSIYQYFSACNLIDDFRDEHCGNCFMANGELKGRRIA